MNFPSDTRLLVICPSRGRPDRIQTMLASFDETKMPGTEMIIWVSEDDPCLSKYKEVLANRHVIYGKRMYIADIFNICSTVLFPAIPYYGEVNDDHVYKSVGWDDAYIRTIQEKGNGWGIACGADNINNNWYEHRHPSACVISGNIIRTLGYFVYPELQHMFIDDYLRDVGEAIGRLYFLPHILVEHVHWCNKKVDWDDNYRWVYSPEQQKYGWEKYNRWVNMHKESDMEKLKAAMKK